VPGRLQGSRFRVGEGTWHGLGANACPGPKKERGPGCNVSAHGDVADQPPAKQPATTSPRPPQENPAGQYGGASVVSATQGAHSCSEPEPNQRPRATIPTRQWGARPRRLHWQVDLGEVVAPQRQHWQHSQRRAGQQSCPLEVGMPWRGGTTHQQVGVARH